MKFRKGAALFFTNFMYITIYLYKKLISPFQYLLRCCFGIACECRFKPTCSEYALQCLKKHPPIRACQLIIKRILRCQPFCSGGYDPVP